MNYDNAKLTSHLMTVDESREFPNRTFLTKVGNVTFNEFGGRISTIMIAYYDPDTGDFEVSI